MVTTYFTRIAKASNEDTVSQQMRFCGYRDSYSHVVTVHALTDIFESFDYLAQVERALISTAQDWEERDKNLLLDEPALWYISRPTNRMKPTRLAVRDRDLIDEKKDRQVLSLRQFAQPRAFARNSRVLLDWIEQREVTRDFLDDWLLVECPAEEIRELLNSLSLSGRDDADRDVAAKLMNPRLQDLGLANLPFALFVRSLEVCRAAASGNAPSMAGLPSRRLAGSVPTNALNDWKSAWTSSAGFRPEEWFDSARLGVPHVGDAQRRPIEKLGYDAVSVIVEPLAVHLIDQDAPVGGGLAVSILSPDGFELRAIGVRA